MHCLSHQEAVCEAGQGCEAFYGSWLGTLNPCCAVELRSCMAEVLRPGCCLGLPVHGMVPLPVYMESPPASVLNCK